MHSLNFAPCAPLSCRKFGLVAWLVLTAASVGCAHVGLAPQRPGAPLTQSAALAAPQGPLPQNVAPLAYSLALALDPNRSEFSGSVNISVRLDKPADLIWLHGQDLQVGEGYAIDAAGIKHRLRYSQATADGVARLDIQPPLPDGVSSLHLRFLGDYNTGLAGLYKVVSHDNSYIFSQFEPLSARRAFPCFDEPRFKTPFQMTLTVPDGLLAISNTAPSGQTTAGQGQTSWTFAPTQPLPTYLTAFAVGPFDVAEAQAPINSVRPDVLPMRGISTRGEGQQMAFAIGHAAGMLEALEQYFQVPYPFDKLDLLAVPDFAAGAMENAGAITFRDWLLLVDPARASTSQKKAYFGVTAHELSHQWFGNWTTMAWWDDLWLNESFATWMGQHIAQQQNPDGHYDWELVEGMHSVMDQDSLSQARRIRQPCPTANDVYSAFDGITYLKGGALLNMFEHYVGAPKFAQGVRSYLQAHPFGTATAEDFVDAVTRAHGDPNTKSALFSFLQQSGVPHIEAAVVCDKNKAELIVAQRPYEPLGAVRQAPRHWQLPICWRAQLSWGIERRCILMDQTQMRVSLGKECPTWLMPNADGAGYYFWQLPAAQLEALVQAPLSAPEQMSVARNVQAALAAGSLAPEAALHSYDTFIKSPVRAVATTPLGAWRTALTAQLEPVRRAAAADYIAAQLRPHIAPTTPAQSQSQEHDVVLQRQLQSFLALVLKDAPTRARLLRQGEALLNWPHQSSDTPTKTLRQDVVDAEFVPLALSVLAEEHKKPAVDYLVGLLAPQAGLEAGARLQIVSALAAVSSLESAATLRALALQPAPLRANEVMQILRNHMGHESLRPQAWQFIKENFLALKKRLPEHDGGSLAALTGYFCDAKSAKDAQAFFAPYIHELAGGPRALAMAQETCALCIAQREAQTPGVQRFFAGLKKRK